ncbi:MAG: Fic family protein [Bilifractor sp.]
MQNREAADAICRKIMYEYKHKIRNGIYAVTSKMMAYNSNRIEGSTLTSEETASLFDTGILVASDEVAYRAKDIEEMNGHFYMFNHALETLEEPLSVELIKSFHFCLKNGVFEDRANGYVPGEFKQFGNAVSNITTSRPSDVPARMQQLIEKYNAVQYPDVHTLMQFHAEYEHIHPFQDGNGRTGRMILFRECLRNHLVPIIVREETKALYYKALHEAQVENNYTKLDKYAEQQQKIYYNQVAVYVFPIAQQAHHRHEECER